jgi:transcriptional regulator with XRE-family HTH domain
MTGDQLRMQRGRLRLTQRELANRIGVGLRTVTTWEALGARPVPGTAEGRLTAIFGAPDAGLRPALSDVSDLELITELTRRLGLPRVGTHPYPAADAAADIPSPAHQSAEEDYPSDASAQGIVGTPRDDTPTHEPTTAWRPPQGGRLRSVAGDSSERRHHRQRP